jgi:hypothetical protein
MASIVVTLSGVWNAADLGINTKDDPRDNLEALSGLLRGLQNGSYSGSAVIGGSATDAVRASCTVTATTSGSLGTVINGTTVTTAFSTSQDGTATQAVADINANTTVNKLVRASKGATNTFVLTALVPGIFGNCCTVTVTGTGASATGSGKLASGAGNDGNPSTYSLA